MTASRANIILRLQRIAGFARRLAPWFALPCLIGFALPWLNRLLPQSSSSTVVWLIDLAAHWQLLYMPLWIALCVLCAVRARRWWLLLPLALMPVFSASTSLPRAHGGSPALIISAANVHAGNRDPMPLVAWLRQQPADVVVISELTPEYAETLKQQLGDDYPYLFLRPKDSPFGIGIVSRRKLYDVREMQLDGGIQLLIAQVRVGIHTARIIAFHPMPPLAPEWHERRDTLLRMLADTASEGPVIVAGDLNATPWSTALIGAERGGLFRSTSLAPTWPSVGLGVFGIPIDHVLASSHWRRGESSRGPDIGSDHLPVRVALFWADDHSE